MDAKVIKSLINSIRKLSRVHNKAHLNYLKKLFIENLVNILNKKTLNQLNLNKLKNSDSKKKMTW